MACHVVRDWRQGTGFHCSDIHFCKLDTNKTKEINYKAKRSNANFQSAKIHPAEPLLDKFQPAKAKTGKNHSAKALLGKVLPPKRQRSPAHMQTLRAEQHDAVRKYYEAFPALTSPPVPPRPPAWVRPAMPPPPRKPRRARRKTRAEPARAAVPDRDDLELPGEWTLDDDPRELAIDDDEFAEFRAKFDSGIEALWAAADTPEDDYRDLPIDLHDLLSSPSDSAFAEVTRGGVWAAAGPDAWPGVDALRDRLRPLTLVDEAFSQPPSIFAPPSPAALAVERSLSLLNHDSQCSGFVTVLPGTFARPPRPPPRPAFVASPDPGEDLLTSSRTHFRPIRREAETASSAAVRHEDGAEFDTRGSPARLCWRLGADGALYAAGSPRRYLQCRLEGGVLRFPAVRADVAVQTETVRTDRKRRHSAALRRCCGLPHAPFLQCCPQDRPLTR